MIKEIVKNNLTDSYVQKYITQQRVCKDKYSINTSVNSFILNLFKLNTIPSFARLSEIKAEDYDELFEKLYFINTSIYKCAEKLKLDYELAIKKYTYAYKQMENIFDSVFAKASVLLEYNCVYINTLKSNQTNNSTASKIGKYSILPFFKKPASIYNDEVLMSVSTQEDLIFSNAVDLTSLPLTKFMSTRITSSKDIFTLNILASINETKTNLIYIKLTNNINSININLKKENRTIKSFSYNTNEILINCEPVSIDQLELNIDILNINKGKPTSIQLEELHIFSNVIFQKSGTFETIQEQINNIENINNIALYANNYGDTTYTNILRYLFISTNNSLTSYRTILDDEAIDLTLYKFRYINNIDSSGEITDNTEEVSIANKTFIASRYTSLDTKWSANIKKANILYGLNKYYIETNGEITSAKRFEPWTLVGNYYVTHILNYEESVYVNIGTKTCILNNKEVTGIVNIPIGISKIQVHVKDIDFHIDDDEFILTKSNILNDNLYPYNFIWIFAGLPEYNTGGGITKVTRGPYSKTECSIISLREPFIPFTEVVKDDSNRIYGLQLTKTTTTQGTYTIEPYGGKISVIPYESANYITVTYNKAQNNNRPCGILFNRLLTYAPNETVITSDNSELFSIDGDSTEKILLMPKLTPQISSSQILFNIEDEPIYSSTKIDLETKSKYLTPIVADLVLQTR